jgi:hypothetical protein
LRGRLFIPFHYILFLFLLLLLLLLFIDALLDVFVLVFNLFTSVAWGSCMAR